MHMAPSLIKHLNPINYMNDKHNTKMAAPFRTTIKQPIPANKSVDLHTATKLLTNFEPAKLLGDDLEIFITDTIEEPVPLISVLSTLIFSAGNISVIGGKQKSRKTFFLSMLIVAYLKRSWGILNGFPSDKPTVLLFDTEQGKSHVMKVLRRTYRMLEWTQANESLKVFYLREQSVNERIEIIKTQIEKHRPEIVFLDGAVDLCSDFNSIEESTKTVQLLMELSAKYNCHISSVLHENKADGNMRGHLGSMMIQKSECAIKLTKDGEITNVSAEATRNIAFEPFCFRVDDDGLPQIIETEHFSKTDVMNSKIQTSMKSVLSLSAMSYARLWQEYCEVAGVGQSTAKKHVATASKSGYITKGSDGNYRSN